MEALVKSTMSNGHHKPPVEIVTQLMPDGTKKQMILKPKV